MPDTGVDDDKPHGMFEVARANVASWLAQLGAEWRSLTAEELRAYPARGLAAGWRLSVQFSSGLRRLDFLLPSGFPWQAPRVALVDRPPFLDWPHVEHDGVLCAAPSTLEVDPDDPARVVASVLGDASTLVERLIAGELDGDFEDEFLSYWDWAADKSGPSFISLLNAVAPTRLVRVWRGSTVYVLGETDMDLKRWLANRFGKKLETFRTDAAGLFWFGAPPPPRNYPRTGQALRALISRGGADANDLLSRLVRDTPDKVVAALAFETANGPALAGTIVRPPDRARHGAHNQLTKGFRPGAVPESILLQRYLGGSNIMRRSIDRADPAWIHGRGQDPRAAQLRGKTVAVIGCGSIGGPIAVTLAQAGVGRLILIDFDRLKWANVGRHPLGAQVVGQFKAKGLAEKLRADFPHIVVDHYDIDVDTAVRRHGDLLATCHLVVSVTGSWAADSRLDAWRESASRRVPVVYGWMEAHACAGHALLLDQGRGCLRCGFDNTGLPDSRVTDWPVAAQTKREPACGAVYQPYGPVELGFVNSLVAELALDTLLGETGGPAHRLWIGPRKRLLALGGVWTSNWRDDATFRDEGGFITERPWLADSCQRCAKAQAA